MAEGFFTELTDRAVFRIGGEDAESFLQGLVTCDVSRVTASAPAYGALLTPQGKILFDFFLMRRNDGLWMDLPRSCAADALKRLVMYKLRARVDIKDLSDETRVFAAWGDLSAAALPADAATDPRLPDLGSRFLIAAGEARAHVAETGLKEASPADYMALRIALGVPEGGLDFEYGQAFPHDADMDCLNGVAFSKGCYVGQEVVSRMKHRGTARRRIVQVSADDPLPTDAPEITSDGKSVGTLGSVSGADGLALVRIDRAGKAIQGGVPMLAGEREIRLQIPGWATFGWPEPTAEAQDGSE